MHTDTVFTTTALRQRYSERIKQLEQELGTLRHKLSLLDEVEADARAIARQVPTGDSPQNGNTRTENAKYKGMGLTDAVLAAINDFGDTGASAPELRDHLVKHGLETTSRHLLNSIYTALTRQVGNHAIQTAMTDGRRKYFPIRQLFRQAQ
jgi:hypothetical protein